MDRILVVDDDLRTRQMLKRYLSGEGFDVLQAFNLHEAHEVLSQDSVSLILLDLKLGAEDGLDLVREIRANKLMIGIIIVSTRDDVVDKIIGLELGADDYLAKPYHLRELLARIRAVMRRQEGSKETRKITVADEQTKSRLYFGKWCLDRDGRRLLGSDGADAKLTVFEYRLLETMILHPKHVFSRDYLIQHIGGRDWNPFDRAIDTHVSRLRGKIEEDPTQPVFIQTVRGEGYMFANRPSPFVEWDKGKYGAGF